MDDYTSPEPGGSRATPRTDAVNDDPSHRSHFAIGEVAREFGFTLRALRFYEEKGLISPMRMGNRRFYSPRDRQRLEIIAQCKRIGLALDEIRLILRSGERSGSETRQMEVALDVFKERVDNIRAEQEELKDSLKEALGAIDDLKSKLGRTH